MALSRKFIITDQIGVGGTATVSKAIQKSLDRFVALKRIHPHLSNDPKYGIRLEREAKSAASLEHVNIMDIIDFGKEEESYYIIAEYIDGPGLSDVLDSGVPMPISVILSTVVQILNGLEHAHNKGVVHRDIKPDNIMFTREGIVKITDFGIAKASDMPALTHADQKVMGTPSYMSPEQAQGKQTDQRSDLFSAGVIFYQMLTGKLPFVENTVMATMKKLAEEPHIPVSQLKPDIAPGLSAIVDRALEKDMAERFFDATEFVYAILKFASELKITFGPDDIKSFIDNRLPDLKPAGRSTVRTSDRLKGLYTTTGAGERPAAAILPLTGCFGCQVNLLDFHERFSEIRDLIDIRFSYFMDVKTIPEVAIGIVEGCVANEKDEARVRELRSKCETLVALGTCACYGGIPGLRNLNRSADVLKRAYSESESMAGFSQPPDSKAIPAIRDHVASVTDVVKTDVTIPGCPSPHKLILNTFHHLIKGAPLEISTHTLCFECKRSRKEMLSGRREFICDDIYPLMELAHIDPDICFLEQGVLCMGLTTQSGCGARCVSRNIPCQGCMGPVPQGKETGAKWISTLGSLLPGGSMRFRHDLVGIGYCYTLPVSMIPYKP